MAYVVNFDEYADTGPHWIALYINSNAVTYFDSFGVEPISKEIKKFINKIAFKGSTIMTNIFKMQAYDSVMCEYFSIGVIDSMLNGKNLTGLTNLFSPNNFKDNDKII